MDAGFDWVVHQAEGEEFVGDFNRATMNEDYWLACPNSVYAGGFNKNCKEVIRGGGYGYICENCGEEFHETAELDAFKMAEYQAEAVPISEEEGLFVVRNNMGQTKGFIEMEDDEEEEAVEIEISDDEMEEIAEIKLGADFRFYDKCEIRCPSCGDEGGMKGFMKRLKKAWDDTGYDDYESIYCPMCGEGVELVIPKGYNEHGDFIGDDEDDDSGKEFYNAEFSAQGNSYSATYKPVEYYLQPQDGGFVIRSKESGTKIELSHKYKELQAEFVVSRLNQIINNTTLTHLQAITNGKQPRMPEFYLRTLNLEGDYAIYFIDEPFLTDKKLAGRPIVELSEAYKRSIGDVFAQGVVKDLNRDLRTSINGLLQFVTNKVGAGYLKDIGLNRAETATYEPSQEPEGSEPATEPTNANFEAQAGSGGILYDDNNNGSMVLKKGWTWLEGSTDNEDYYGNCDSCSEDLDAYYTGYVVDGTEWSICMECFDKMPGREGVTVEYKDGTKRAESKSMFSKDKNGKMYARRRNGRIITHNADFVKDSNYSFEPYADYGGFAHDTDDCRGTLRFEEDSRIGVCEDCGEEVQISEKDYDWIMNEWFGAESKSMFSKDKNGKMYARRRNGRIITHNADFVKPSRDWLSLALGTAAVVIGGSLFLQNRGVFKADGDEMAPVGTEEPSLVAHPTTGDLLPADYEEMIVESTGYAVPVIPVSLDPSFMGSRFHALPTDRVVESNEPGIGAHTDVAINRDTNYREPEQSLITEPPFAYRFNAEAACKCSIFDKIKSFFTGKPCCVEEKEANSVTGQTPYFGVGFDGRNTQERVIKETNPVSLDPSVSPFLPLNLSGYTGQAYAPPSIYSSMMAVGETGQNPAFTSTSTSVGSNRAGSRSVDSSALQSVHGTLSANVNQSYTDGSRTMSLSQWSIEYDVSQISDTEAFAVSRASGERSMIRRV